MKCPGQDMQFWTSEAIYEVKCPKCAGMVEFYKDDTSRKCGHCGHRFVNPKMDFGCASYCQFAEQCIGDLPEEFVAQRDNLLKDKVAVEMKRYFKSDFRQISHASRVARHAERIAGIEEANPAVILCASYLLNIGYPEAVRKHGERGASDYVEEESTAIAKEILAKLGANERLVGSVCTIIEHHRHPASGESKEFQIVSDANHIASFEEQYKNASLTRDECIGLIDELCTVGGRTVAQTTIEKLGVS